METKITEHTYKAGDIFLEPDGWGYILGKPTLGTDDSVFTLSYLNENNVSTNGYYFSNIDGVKEHILDRKCVYLYNICDIFKAAKEAINEDTST